MTLPRLRVRELLFLVVYVALIGQAFVLGITERETWTSPSVYPGYVWMVASDLGSYELSCSLSHPWENDRGSVWIAGIRDPVPAWILKVWGWPKDAIPNEALYLVPDSSPEGVAIREAQRTALEKALPGVRIDPLEVYGGGMTAIDQSGNVFVFHTDSRTQ